MSNLPSQSIPCILVASHISKTERISLLIDALLSLIQQTYSAHIYLSISFENEDMRRHFIRTIYNNKLLGEYPYFFAFIRPNKTPQMRHFALLFPEIIEKKHEWIFFCDDDDIYDKNRVKIFMNAIRDYSEYSVSGLYESTFQKNHREQRHEYWCYCVHIDILRRFYLVVHKYEDVLDHQCCDVLFGEYLRRLSEKHVFLRITEPLYHYKTENNSDSITGTIQKLRSNWVANPPALATPHFPEYIIALNDYLHKNIHLYLHDTYLRTLIGNSFNQILEHEFKADYIHLKYLDDIHVEKLKTYYDYLKGICNELYDFKLD